MYELKMYYSAQELVDLKISYLPKTKKAVIAKAAREQWVKRKREAAKALAGVVCIS